MFCMRDLECIVGALVILRSFGRSVDAAACCQGLPGRVDLRVPAAYDNIDRCFVIPTHFPKDLYIAGVVFRPPRGEQSEDRGTKTLPRAPKHYCDST